MTVEESLCSEFKSFCDTYDYEHLSADELYLELLEIDVPQSHLDYLKNFIQRWDEANF